MSKVRRQALLKTLKTQIDVFRRALDDPRTPKSAKWLGVGVLAYLASPIDLIPDFIPVLGQLDDLIVGPVGLYAVYKMIPKAVWADAKAAAGRANG